MPRYIDADNFAKQAYEVAYPIVHDNNSHERGLTLMGIAQLLDEQSTADVVKVVRCKNCVKREICRTATIWAVHPDNDWFCADGKRADT